MAVGLRLPPAPRIRLTLVGGNGDDRLKHPAIGLKAILVGVAERIEHLDVDGAPGVGLPRLVGTLLLTFKGVTRHQMSPAVTVFWQSRSGQDLPS
jgi:hypothetical protein